MHVAGSYHETNLSESLPTFLLAQRLTTHRLLRLSGIEAACPMKHPLTFLVQQFHNLELDLNCLAYLEIYLHYRQRCSSVNPSAVALSGIAA